MDVTVITPTIPSRTHLLTECIASVSQQEEGVGSHLIGVDNDGRGPGPIRNKLLEAVTTEWVTFLDDDDILFNNHFSIVNQNKHNGDLIYTFCSSIGRDNFNPNSLFDEKRLRSEGNYIPITVTVKTSYLRLVGGFSDARLEDWDLWIRLLDAGAQFHCVPVVTWCYRFLGENRTFNDT